MVETRCLLARVDSPHQFIKSTTAKIAFIAYVSHSGLLDPLGTKIVLKVPGVLDKMT